MSDSTLGRDRILDAAEDVLRRFGPAKTNVVDVARALGVSHGSVYRHFESKAALREAVAERWLARLCAPLDAVMEEPGPALDRVERWLRTLMALKQQKLREDPELFATYVALAAESREVIHQHVAHLLGQLQTILDGGVSSGQLPPRDTATDARAVFDATTRFHHPAHAAEWSEPGAPSAFDGVWSLLRAALARPAEAQA